MASTVLSRTPTSNGNQKTWTLSTWVKKTSVGTQPSIIDAYYGNQSRYFVIYFDTNDNLNVFGGVYTTGSSTTHSAFLVTNRKFRDTSAWYHIVVAIDTTQATSSDRAKLYINGVQETSFSTETYPSLNDDTFFNVTTAINRVGQNGFDGLMSHLHFIDGTAYDASTFGQFNSDGVWTPKTAPSVTYGTNGFFLKFENSANMDLDSSPNNLTFSTSGTLTQTVDTPSNVFATINPLDNYYFGGTFTNGNNTVQSASASYAHCSSSHPVEAGKWYVEVKGLNVNGAERLGVGSNVAVSTSSNLGNSSGEAVIYPSGNAKVDGTDYLSWGTSWTTNDIVGIALDLDNSKIYFSKNGTWMNSADPAAGTGGLSITPVGNTTNGFYFFGFGDNWASGTSEFAYNFGNGYFQTTAVSTANSDGDGLGIFEYSVPTGFYSVCTKNIANYG